MISVDQARTQIVEKISPLGSEQVDLGSSLGRILAQAIEAPIDLPPFTSSAVDGYACRAEDLAAPENRLRVVGRIAAGEAPLVRLGAGEAARLFTGSAVPEGADCVLMQEDVRVVDGTILAPSAKAGAHVRLRGEELRRGQGLFEAGTPITPGVLGMLANVGMASVAVHQRPRIGVLSTGSELAPPGQPLQYGQVYASNAYGVKAAIEAIGARIGDVRVVRDEKGKVLAALSEMLEGHDCILTCGGVSVGDHDLVREEAAQAGVEEVFWKVAVKPGKPFFFGAGPRGQPVFGLPGNPVSALVCLFVLARPGILKMMGVQKSEKAFHARVTRPIRKQKGRMEYLRGRVLDSAEGAWVEILERQGSHMASGLALADCLVEADAERDSYEEGETVRALHLNWSYL